MSRATENKDRETAARSKNSKLKRGSGAARVTKKQELIRLLSKKAGAEIASLSVRFGWQRHTTRAALSGLRKDGFELTKIEATDGKPTRYRIVDTPPEPVSRPKEEAVTDAR